MPAKTRTPKQPPPKAPPPKAPPPKAPPRTPAAPAEPEAKLPPWEELRRDYEAKAWAERAKNRGKNPLTGGSDAKKP